MPQQGDLLSKIRDFYADVVIPYTEMPDAFESLKQDMRQMDKNLYFLKNEIKSKQG